MKKILVSFAVIAIVGSCIYWWLNSETTLVDLQKAYLLAESDKEREEVIDRLEAYYLNLDVPDSIRQYVDDEVASLLETTEIDPAAYAQDQWDTTNVYRLENQLRDLIKTAMIARAREEASLFRELMGVAGEMAERVDDGTGADYWVGFVDEKSGVTKKQAVAWLKADRSARLCTDYHDGEKWRLAECYGSIALTYLRKTNDSRIRLDILQRLQFILYTSRGLFDISIAFASRSLIEAKELDYILRVHGIAYHQADALYKSGNIEEALDRFKQLKNSAEKNSRVRVPAMSWFIRKSLIRIAESYFWLSEINKTLSICKELEKIELSESDKLQLHITRGLANRGLGNYHKAESEYKNALVIAKSIPDVRNQKIILNNMGYMFYELTEYNEALNFYDQVQALIQQFFPEDYEYKINLLINIARVKEKQGEMETVELLLSDANKLLKKLGVLPYRKAELLTAIGNFSSEIGRYQEAVNKFHEAEALCNRHGLVRLELEIKIKLAANLISIGRYWEAKDRINESLHKAKKYEDVERVIDSLALLADLEYKEGNLDQAVEISDRLIEEIENITHHRFEGSRRLVSYHQKIYNYLKNAVTYEILLGHLDEAFAKLDYAKSLSLQYQVAMDNGVYRNDTASPGLPYVDRLKSQIGKQSLLLNFLLINNELYLFTLGHDSLQLFRKKIDSDSLKKTVNAYIDTLHETVEIFNGYNVNTIDNHFKNTSQLGHRLFRELMGWPELRKSLAKVDVVYLIPDEFLYKLPFATLVVNGSEPITYLVHNVAVVHLRSASTLKSENEWLEKPDPENINVLISADPNFQEMDEFVSDIKELISTSQMLVINKKEVETKDIIEKLSENFDVYVFSGHSMANPIDPELSYIEVSAKNSLGANHERFKVKLADLRALKWSSPRLVLLVGCETAGGKLYQGSGFLGLQNLLLSKGAQNVLASLWKIDGAQSIPQTKDYLRFYMKNFNPSLALRKTQIKAINYFNNHSYYRNPHPYFWGSYTLHTNVY